ncbi:MAG TPA: hypothetical protein VJ809_17210 [Pirellulales bacterium]|nr:hypothetical protein [Pirellulales bacterium]
MPVYTLEGPDGKTYDVEGPPGATAEELGAFVTSQMRAAPKGFVGSALEGARNLGAGVATGFGQIGSALLSPADLAYDALKGQSPGTSNRLRRESIGQFGKENADPESINYIAGNVAPELAATGGGIAKTGEAIARALPKALGRYAPAAGDIAANAAYEAGKAAHTGGDVGTSAAYGAGGAAGGRVLARTLGGMKPLLSREAQALADAGVLPTPGQMLGPAGRFAEDAASVLPGVGHVIDYSRNRALGEYAGAEVNRAIAPLGVTVSGRTTEDAVAAASKAIDDTYERVKPQTFITPTDVKRAAGAAQREIRQIPLLTEQQERLISRYYNAKIAPQIAQAERAGGNVDGNVAKAIDAEIGALGRKFANASDPSHHPLGKAFYTLQANLRDALDATTPEAKKSLEAANAAYRNMLDVREASTRAVASRGRFSPTQMRQVAGKGAGNLNTAARDTLTAPIRNATLPRMAAGAGGIGLGGTAALAAGTGLSALLYSRPALNFIVHGLSRSPFGFPDSAHTLASLPPEKAAREIQRLAAKYPSFAQAVAQLGRAYASQQGAQ